MPIDKAIDSVQLDANLTAVADAIRAKGETTEQLVFPDGFVAAIAGMETGKTGATLTVTTPAEGVAVTVTKGELSYTQTTGADGTATFSGLETGTWTITISDGSQTATGSVDIDADYAAELTFFAATINVTYPAGLVCTATDGVTTLTAPDTSGTWACIVPNAGTWTVSLNGVFEESVEISANGDEKTIYKWHIYDNGDDCASVSGGWGIIKSGNDGSITFGNNSIVFKNTQTNGYAYAKPLNFNPELLSKFSVLKVNTSSYSVLGSENTCSIAIYEDLSAEQKAYTKITKTGITSHSLDGANGYPALRTYGGNMTVTEYWFEV